MSPFTRDPLLSLGRAIVTFLMGVALLVSAALLIAIPAMLLASTIIVEEITVKGATADAAEIFPAVMLIVVLVLGLALVAFVFLRLLRRIIDSLAAGDPFVPENADRLRRMGWLVLVFQGLVIAIGTLGSWLESTADNVRVDIDLSIGAFLLALVLFILARVFRQGAAMREDLEGTV